MTATYTVADCAQDRLLTVTGATEAGALRLVYETLVDWNADDQDCSAAIEQGYIAAAPSGARNNGIILLDSEPVSFWHRCASVMLVDNQDFAEGEASPFTIEDDA